MKVAATTYALCARSSTKHTSMSLSMIVKIEAFHILLIIFIMKIKLFIDYISQPSRAVIAFCKIHNIPVEIQ